MDDDLALVYMWAFKKGEEKSKKRIEELEAALRKIAQHDLQAIAVDALRPGERIALAGEKKDD